MALIKCGECGSEVSDKAVACPKCGAPVVVKAQPQPSPPKNNWALGALILSAVLGYTFLSNTRAPAEKPAEKPVEPPRKEACASDNLQCRGDAGAVTASLYCKDPIERLSKYSVRWIDGTFESKISRFRWTNKPGGTITYIGDKAEFQNGFGAFARVVYECELSDDLKKVLNVRFREGRLPD